MRDDFGESELVVGQGAVEGRFVDENVGGAGEGGVVVREIGAVAPAEGVRFKNNQEAPVWKMEFNGVDGGAGFGIGGAETLVYFEGGAG